MTDATTNGQPTMKWAVFQTAIWGSYFMGCLYTTTEMKVWTGLFFLFMAMFIPGAAYIKGEKYD